jgi:hypothetical protein
MGVMRVCSRPKRGLLGAELSLRNYLRLRNTKIETVKGCSEAAKSSASPVTKEVALKAKAIYSYLPMFSISTSWSRVEPIPRVVKLYKPSFLLSGTIYKGYYDCKYYLMNSRNKK